MWARDCEDSNESAVGLHTHTRARALDAAAHRINERDPPSDCRAPGRCRCSLDLRSGGRTSPRACATGFCGARSRSLSARQRKPPPAIREPSTYQSQSAGGHVESAYLFSLVRLGNPALGDHLHGVHFVVGKVCHLVASSKAALGRGRERKRERDKLDDQFSNGSTLKSCIDHKQSAPQAQGSITAQQLDGWQVNAERLIVSRRNHCKEQQPLRQ